MIAVDSSSMVAFLNGDEGADVELIDRELADETLILPPIVIAEILSARNISDQTQMLIASHEPLPLKSGFWERVGANRREILKAGKKARLADSMIATYCLDHGLALICRDSDFRHFADHFGLVIKTGSSC